MDLKEKAIIRNQLGDITQLQFEVRADLKIVTSKLKLIDEALALPLSIKQKKSLERQKKVYLQNQRDLLITLRDANRIIKELKMQSTPRAFLF